jgi:hypothetical protein
MKVVEIVEQLGAHVDITLKNGWILSVKDPNDKYAPTSETHAVCNGDTGELREVYTHTGEIERGERYDRPPKSPPAAVWVWKLRRLESVLFSAAVAALPSGGEVQTFSRRDRCARARCTLKCGLKNRLCPGLFGTSHGTMASRWLFRKVCHR